MGTRIAAALLGLAVVVATFVAHSGYPRDQKADFVLVASNPASTTLRVQAGFGGCSTFRRADVAESSSQVRISVIVHTTGTDCKSNLELKTIDIALRAPLGSRAVLGECTGGERTVCASVRSLAPSVTSP